MIYFILGLILGLYAEWKWEIAKNKVNKAMLKVPNAKKIDQNNFSNLRSNL